MHWERGTLKNIAVEDVCPRLVELSANSNKMSEAEAEG